ncbi:MAG TPA: IS21-like element helper ATPase IstB [Chitinophagales bacterium]|nr:IS21-like element helper ATPase IstB [Chitinophagales bacterium]HRK29259.1 IS21-like element helper ATPase IstB [Chitinophagales bacterium]
MNTQETLVQLKTLRLSGMSQSYQAILQPPVHQQPEAHDLIAQPVDAENLHRTNKRTQLYLKNSKLRYTAMIEQLAFSDQRQLTKNQILQLADCTFIKKAENILISGATGAGKSFLACAIGHQACLMGFKTRYLNFNRFIETILQTKLDGTYAKLLNQLEKTQLLIFDDFGLCPIDNQTRLALLQILEDRYAKYPTIIAAQLPIAKWYEIIGEPTIADAVLDRLLAHAHRFELKGHSLRHPTIQPK